MDRLYIRDADEILFDFFLSRVQLRKGTRAEISLQKDAKTSVPWRAKENQRKKREEKSSRAKIKIGIVEQRRQGKEWKQSNTCWQIGGCFEMGNKDKMALDVSHDSKMTQVVKASSGRGFVSGCSNVHLIRTQSKIFLVIGENILKFMLQKGSKDLFYICLHP